MIVECPNCQAKFRLADEKIGPQGAKLRCGKCRHVFSVEPPAPSLPPEAAGLTDFDFPDDMAPPPEAPPAPRSAVGAPATDKDAPPDQFHTEAYETPGDDDGLPRDDGPTPPGFSLDDVADIPLPGSRPSTDRRRRLLVLGGAVLFVVIVAVSAVVFLDVMPGKKSEPAPETPPAATAPAQPEKAAPPATDKPATPAAEPVPTPQKPEDAAKVKDIMLQNVRQYYVSNEKAGQLFVIEGKAVNNFKTPKEMIKLEATLFDEKGGSLASQESLAGNTVSLFQLQVMTRDELKNALSSQVGVLTNNTNLATGGEAPFMIVFFDPPEAVKEFGVKVVDAKDPPRQ
jgi:predicted Zn finger-like uncharacterized protein